MWIHVSTWWRWWIEILWLPLEGVVVCFYPPGVVPCEHQCHFVEPGVVVCVLSFACADS